MASQGRSRRGTPTRVQPPNTSPMTTATLLPLTAVRWAGPGGAHRLVEVCGGEALVSPMTSPKQPAILLRKVTHAGRQRGAQHLGGGRLVKRRVDLADRPVIRSRPISDRRRAAGEIGQRPSPSTTTAPEEFLVADQCRPRAAAGPSHLGR